MTHLPDHDTMMENPPAVADQVRTLRAVLPDCTVDVAPSKLPPADANQPIAGAWTAEVIKYLSLAGVNQAAFGSPSELQTNIIEAIRPYVGQKLLAVETEPADSHHLTTFEIDGKDGVALFLINRTAHAWHAEVQGAVSGKTKVQQIASGSAEQAGDAENGMLKVELPPYGVCRVTIAK